ncbi:MAG: CHAT domain-containing protein [Chloroflexota bacterium]
MNDIDNLLMTWLQTPTDWPESQAFITEHADVLLTHAGEAALQQMLASSQGNEQTATWVQQYLTLLQGCRTQGIEKAYTRLSGEVSNEGKGADDTTDFANNLQSLLQKIRRVDVPHRIQLYQEALINFNRQQHPRLWAILCFKLGDSLAQNLQGNRTENIEQAITAYQDALQVMTRNTMPVEWATTTVSLAVAYKNRIRGEKAENIEPAITAYQDVLQVFTYNTMPVEWATTCMNLANAYRRRIRGDKAENIELAIYSYQDALQVMTRNTMPVEWATTRINLANAYYSRIRGEKAENIELAIATYQDALQVMTQNAMPFEWAQTINNLAIAYSDRIRGEKAENVELAIAAYQDALQVRTRNAMPFEWADTTSNLASAYSIRIRGEKAENIELAIAAYQDALQVWTRNAMPFEWAQITCDLAKTYLNRIRGDKAENIELAIAAFHDALQVVTYNTMPVEWAQMTSGLASAYSIRIRGEKAENIEFAIATFHDALQVRTRNAMPVEWAQTINNLASAYINRIRGEKAENIELAIAAYQDVLQVHTYNAMPIEWAQAQTNLATAYINRIRGDKAENIELAIAAYQDALQVMSHNTMPIEWAQTTMNLALAYWQRIIGDKAGNIELAIADYQDALQVMSHDAMPVEWAQARMNLALAYYSRIRGDKAENIELAIAAYQDALQVRTRNAMPVEWSEVTNNLAAAYVNRIRGDKEENIELAIAAYQDALQVRTRNAMPVEWAQTTMSLAATYANRIRGDKEENIELAIAVYQDALLVMTRSAMPIEHQQTLQNLGRLFFDQQQWQNTAHTLIKFLAVTDDLYQLAALPSIRQVVVQNGRGDVERLVYAACHTSFQPVAGRNVHDALREAVLALDLNRARWLRERLDLRGQRPQHISKAQWQQFMEQGERIRKLQAEAQLSEDTPGKREFLVLSDLLRTARQELDTIADAIRQTAPDFLPTANFDEVQSVAKQMPLIYLVTTSAGSAALVVQGNTVTPMLLDGFTNNDLLELLVEQGNVDEFTGYLIGQFTSPRQLIGQVNPLLGTLGTKLIAPIASVLRGTGQGTNNPMKRNIVLIPVGHLALLPLHAARYPAPNSHNAEMTTLMDEFTVHYAPSARSLTRSLEQSARPRVEKLTGVGNPRPLEGQHNFTSLPHAQAEMEEICELLPLEQSSALYGQDATQARLLANLPGTTLLHLSCHGTFNPEEPLDSGLQLADGLLSLRTLLDPAFTGLDNTRLVTLSACQTAISDFQNVPNEVIGLPAGFLQAGVPGVVGTLWPVEDRATSLLMRRFYDNYLNHEMEPAQALRDAQLWLRDVTRKELGDYYKAFFLPRMAADEAQRQWL